MQQNNAQNKQTNKYDLMVALKFKRYKFGDISKYIKIKEIWSSNSYKYAKIIENFSEKSPVKFIHLCDINKI
jgi:hypothetical protein